MEEEGRAMSKQEISEFSVGIRTLVGEMAAEHNQLHNVQAMEEVPEYVFRINKEIPETVLPELDIPEQIF